MGPNCTLEWCDMIEGAVSMWGLTVHWNGVI